MKKGALTEMSSAETTATESSEEVEQVMYYFLDQKTFDQNLEDYREFRNPLLFRYLCNRLDDLINIDHLKESQSFALFKQTRSFGKYKFTEDLFEYIAKSNSQFALTEISKNEASPPEILAQLPREKYRWIAVGLSRNPSTPIEILEELSKHEDPYVRRCVVDNPSTSDDIVQQMSDDLSSDVQTSIGLREHYRRKFGGIMTMVNTTPLSLSSFSASLS